MLCWQASKTPLVVHATGVSVTDGGQRRTVLRNAVCALSRVVGTVHPAVGRVKPQQRQRVGAPTVAHY